MDVLPPRLKIQGHSSSQVGSQDRARGGSATTKLGDTSPVNYQGVVDDGRWVPDANYLTVRHNKRGDVNFADGHAQAVDYCFAIDPNNTLPDR